MDIGWKEGVGFVGAAGFAAGVLAKLWRRYISGWWSNLKAGVARRRILENFRVSSESGRLMQRLLDDWKGMRVLLLRASDNGTFWEPGEPVFTTCLDQRVDTTRNVTDSTKRCSNIETDRSYKENLRDICENGDRGTLLIAQELRPGFLRDLYDSDGTVASIVFPVHFEYRKRAMVYVSVNFGQPLSPTRVSLPKEDVDRWVQTAKKIYGNREAVRKRCADFKRVWYDK